MEVQPTSVGETEKAVSKGPVWRLQGVFFEPSATFEDIDAKPGFLVPFLVSIVLSLLTWVAIGQLVDLEEVFIANMKANPQVSEQLTTEQIRQQAQFTVPIVTYAGPVVGVPLVVFVTAGVMLLLVWISGAESTFGKLLGVVSHTVFFQTVVGGVLMILVFALAADPTAIQIENPVMTNPGSLVDVRESPVLNRLLSSLDIVVWYVIFLLGLGLSKVARPMTAGRGFALVAVPYLLYVGVRMGFAALFG